MVRSKVWGWGPGSNPGGAANFFAGEEKLLFRNVERFAERSAVNLFQFRGARVVVGLRFGRATVGVV